MADKFEEGNSRHAEVEVTQLAREAAAADVAEITTKNPYTEVNFIGTYVAILMGVIASYGGYVMPVTSLAFINDDIGPSVNINWVPLVWTLFLALGYTLVGRLSDIFGRRWFFIVSSAIALVGTIVAATAQTIGQLIAANALIGLAGAPQISFNYVLGEIVPVKHRFFANSMLFLIAFPITGMGPYFSRLFIVYTAGGWRWDYYFSIIINAVGTLSWFLFYHPPSFEGLHKNRSRMQEIKDLDIGGITLFMAGLVLFTMFSYQRTAYLLIQPQGLSWGGSLYPWESAHVIATLVVGIVVIIAFILYEIYMPLNRPLIPMHLYRNREYCVITILAVLGGMIYYSMNVIYPTMIATLFSTDVVYGGLLSTAIGGGTAAGQFSGSLLATPGGHMKWKLIFVTACLTAFVGGMAGAGYSQATASALITMGSVALGAIEALAIGVVTIVIEDQKEMGVASGVFGSLRSVGGVVATSIYVAILQNKVAANTESDVVPALLKAGLPQSSVEELLTALTSGSSSAISAVPGVTSQILAVAGTTLKAAYSDSFKIVFLATIPFGVVATIAAFFARDIDSRLTHDVVRRLDLRGKRTDVPQTRNEKEESTHDEHV